MFRDVKINKDIMWWIYNSLFSNWLLYYLTPNVLHLYYIWINSIVTLIVVNIVPILSSQEPFNFFDVLWSTIYDVIVVIFIIIIIIIPDVFET